ncbi:MAG: amidohydrolase [Bacillota bacterium]
MSKDKTAFINGRIFTGLEEVEAILVEGNKVSITGPTSLILQMIGDPKTSSVQIVDLKGKRVIPGFVDSHNHVLAACDLLEGVNCFGLKSIEEVKEAVARKAQEKEKGEWITGAGWIESQFEEKRMINRYDLDEAAPDNPVCLSRLFGLSSVNSKALEAAGIGRGFVPTAGRVELDEHQEPTGIIREAAQGLITQVIRAHETEPSQEILERRILLVLNELLRYGVTSILDPGIAGDVMRAYASLWVQKKLPMRVSAMPTWHGKSVIQGEYLVNPIVEAGLQPGFGDSWFRLGNLKMAIDGGLGTKTAMMHEPFVDGTRSTIPARVDLNQLGDYISNAHLLGWGVGVHCCGDLAQDICLAHMVDAISKRNPLPYHRHHIIHGYLPTPYALKVMSDYDIGISLQPGFIYVEGDVYPQAIPEEKFFHFKPAKTYLNQGIKVAINTDVPSGPYNPFVTLYGAVARKTMGGLDFGKDEALTAKEAVQCFTQGGAYLAYRDKECGDLAEGKYADMAVLDRDIFEIDPEELLETKALATIIGGQFVYVADDAPNEWKLT